MANTLNGASGGVIVTADGTNTLQLQTNATGAVTIDSSQNVGVGTATPGNKLEVSGTFSASGVATFSAGTAAAPAITTSGDTNNGIFFPAADVTAITTAGSERMRVNALGNVGIGGTPSSGNTPRLLVQSAFASPTGLSPYNGLYIVSTDAVAADKGGVISFGGLYQTGQEDTRWAAIAGLKENATDGQYGGYLSLYSRANGSLGPNERIRITAAGDVGVGLTAPATKLDVLGTSGIRAIAAATQDAVIIKGRAGGTGSYSSTITPATLSASRTVTLPDETFTVGFRNLPPVGTKTGSYTLAVGDVGKYVQVGSGGSITIPDATFAEGDALSIFNNTTGNITITCTITTAYIAGTDADKASVTLATRGVATILFISSTVCVISGNVS